VRVTVVNHTVAPVDLGAQTVHVAAWRPSV